MPRPDSNPTLPAAMLKTDVDKRGRGWNDSPSICAASRSDVRSGLSGGLGQVGMLAGGCLLALADAAEKRG
jgi:hypothetical protein